MLDWVKEDGSRGFYSDPSQRPPYALEREVIALLRRLRGLAPFRREPWTHAQVTLAADGRVRADFAYVDRDDEWANLYMRGASELTLEEAGQNFIPAPDWAEKPRRAILRLETKAAALEATSLFEDAVRVGAQLEPSGDAWRPTNELDGAEGSRPTQRPPRVENGLSTSHPPSTRREPGRSIR